MKKLEFIDLIDTQVYSNRFFTFILVPVSFCGNFFVKDNEEKVKMLSDFRPPNIEAEIFYDELRFWNFDVRLIETFIEDDMVRFYLCFEHFLE